MRISRVLISILICLLLLPGCGRKTSSSRSSGVTEITFWNGFTGPDGTTMEKMVRRFNQEHPEIRVRMQIIPWSTYYDKVTLGLAYGGAPDVFILHVNRFPEYANYGALSQIDDLVKAGGIDSNDFVPVAWNAPVFKGKRYAIPLDCHPIGLYYNTALFKQAGIVDANGNAKPPTNMAEFIEDGRKLTRDTNGDGKPDQWAFAFTWLRTNAATFMNQYGTGLFDKDLRRCALDTPEAKGAMNRMVDLIVKYKICPKPEGQDAWIGFQTGKVAMALEGIYMIASLEDQKGLQFAGAPCPLFGKKRAVWAGTHLLTMPRGITPEHRKAAWTFMRYLSDHSLEWAKGGQVPVRKSILASAEFKKLPIQYQFSKQLSYVVYEPASISYNQVVPFSDAAVEAILNRVQTPETAFDIAVRRVDKVVARE